ncbi:MAG: helix-turn-helix transcriptional regulator [Dehalococcoidia bacterium]
MTQERPEFSRPGLTPSEEMMLGWIRDGLVDAEIAVRLGISNHEVKERIERLTSRLGVRNRDGLRNGASSSAPEPVDNDEDATEPEPARNGWRLLASPLVLPLITVGVVGAAFVVWAHRHSTDEEVAQGDTVLRQLEANPDLLDALFESNGPIRVRNAPTTEIRNGNEVFSLGWLFDVPSSRTGADIESASMDGNRARITLAGAGIFNIFSHGLFWRPQNATSPNGTFVEILGGKRVKLHLEAADESTKFLYGDLGGLFIVSEDSGLPTILVWVDGRDIEVTSNGEFYISAD